jgi:hypothetical protein
MESTKVFRVKALALAIAVGLGSLSTAASADILEELKAQIDALQKKVVELEQKQDKTEQKQAGTGADNVVTGGASKGSFKLPGSNTSITLGGYVKLDAVFSNPSAGIDAKGGKNSLYAQDYAARVALELGADVVKLHEPQEDNAGVPAPYRGLREGTAARTQRVVRSAGRTLVLFSGGEKDDDDAAVLRKVKFYMDSGATGIMFGRNMWLRPYDRALKLSRAVQKILAKYPR